jgi:putative membrane protein insertion efficiency factor
VRKLLLTLIRVYQVVLSPLVGDCCRFYPSCSHYCAEAVEKHGAMRGLMLGIRRILRCNPFGPSGADPVPDPVKTKSP